MVTKRQRDQMWVQGDMDNGNYRLHKEPLFGQERRSVGFKDNYPYPGPGKLKGGKPVTKKKGPTRTSPKLAKPKPRAKAKK